MGSVIMIGIKTIAPIMILILAGLVFYMRRKKQRSIGYILCFTVFYVYLLYVVHYTIFPIRLFAHNDLIGVNWKIGLNFIPFRELTLAYLLSIQGLGNVLLTVPFGFGLPFITDISLKSIIWKGILFSVSIEFLQFLENIFYLSGYIVRSVDINDVILNTVGALLGFGLFYMLSWAYHKSISPNETAKGAWEHIHKTLAKGK